MVGCMNSAETVSQSVPLCCVVDSFCAWFSLRCWLLPPMSVFWKEIEDIIEISPSNSEKAALTLSSITSEFIELRRLVFPLVFQRSRTRSSVFARFWPFSLFAGSNAQRLLGPQLKRDLKGKHFEDITEITRNFTAALLSRKTSSKGKMEKMFG